MIRRKNFSLQKLNTFGISCKAARYISLENTEEIPSLYDHVSSTDNILILGGGSNILFLSDFDGTIVHPVFKGIRIVKEQASNVIINVMAGEEWDDVVDYAVSRNLGGIENLSLIPGNTGSAPIQNIGAYGVELKDVFEGLDAWHIEEKKWMHFSKEECSFGYRDSIFKREFRAKLIIKQVQLRLNCKPIPDISYGSICSELEKREIDDPDIADIRKAIIDIRRSKLPEPEELGNAGSFFKNPEVNLSTYKALKNAFPEVVSFKINDDQYKIAAGWMIEQCGWKGKREGDAGVHRKQALVLVNHGNASGQEILELSEKIQKSVSEKFGINIEREVNAIGLKGYIK